MLPSKAHIINLLQAGDTSFMLYGQKSSGKTTFISEILKEADIKHIEINCTLAQKKSNFLKLLNIQLSRYLRQHDQDFQTLAYHSNIQSWSIQMRNVVKSNDYLAEALDGLYLFMDNIEELNVGETFMRTFFTACTQDLPFKFNFILVGINYGRKTYALEEPFRNLISFCMPRPVALYDQIIKNSTDQYMRQLYKDKKIEEQELKKAINAIFSQIRAAFEGIEFNLEKIKNITQVVLHQIHPNTVDRPHKDIMTKINKNEMRTCLHKVIEYGPQYDYEIERKHLEEDVYKNQNFDLTLEYYPNLIMTSIHLADYYPDSEDKRRFQDYKNFGSNARKKDLKKNEFKITRHNVQRIVAISEALESQAKPNKKEYILPHHSLDYYACFEHLRQEGRIKVLGKNDLFGGGKIAGVAKEQDARGFMKKYDLKYEQFMG